ncbi:MAG: hypothetical protein LBS29_01250 [Endomicrobium sp.]|jgi:hypothetical protein|nr:hypothetical protein [Endomicrobium sp.]
MLNRFNKGQAFLETLFVILFITIIMFTFLQICIITVDDMVANEVAFVSARSVAVTENKLRLKEAKDKAQFYISFFYPFSLFSNSNFNPSHFVFVSKKDFEKNFSVPDAKNNKEYILGEDSSDSTNFVTLWKGKKKAKDYSGKELCKETIKIYYFTRVLFGYLIAKDNSIKNRRYQSARNRIIPSPDEKYYLKAFPGAKEFEK